MGRTFNVGSKRPEDQFRYDVTKSKGRQKDSRLPVAPDGE